MTIMRNRTYFPMEESYSPDYKIESLVAVDND